LCIQWCIDFVFESEQEPISIVVALPKTIVNPFKDNFSKQSKFYSKFRPTYPIELFEFLQTLTPEHRLAWDCGTGNGQSAIQLARFYEKVFATDPSEEQIKNAFHDPKVTYRVEKAENPSLNDRSVDLITVAQAVHWFDFDGFYAQVKRVLKPNGIIAVWAYGIPSVTSKIDELINDYHDNVIGEFWLPENRLIDEDYSTIPFPFKIIEAPEFWIYKSLDRDELLGHFRSWSATQKYIDKNGTDPVVELEKAFKEVWVNGTDKKEVAWKLILKTGEFVCD